MPSISLLDIPRELRDKIYLEYVLSDPDRTYLYDFESNKLTMSNGQPIDLALMSTCKQIAAEMRGLALRINTIVFKTVYSDKLRPILGRFNFLVHQRIQRMEYFFTRSAPRMSYEEMEPVIKLYPEVAQALRAAKWRPEPPRLHRYISYSTLNQEVLAFALQTWLRLHPCLDHHIKERHTEDAKLWWDSIPITKVASLDLSPWAIPTDSELDEIMEVTESSRKDLRTRYWWRISDGGKYRLSAAAAAIHFFNSIPHARRFIQARVLIDEDQRSVAFPECHGAGLIPFCRENPNLLITRRVSLWHNMIFFRVRPEYPMWSQDFETTVGSYAFFGNAIHFDKGSNGVEHWMVQASDLQRKGMPAGRFVMVIDGRPAPAQARKLFQKIIQRTVSWQEAFVRMTPEAERETSLPQRRMVDGWQLHLKHPDFPRLVKELVRDRRHGPIRCNFDPGNTEDPNMHIQWLEGLGWTCLPIPGFDGEKVMMPTKPPLPPWKDMMLANMMDWFKLELTHDPDEDDDDDDEAAPEGEESDIDSVHGDDGDGEHDFLYDEELWLTPHKPGRSTTTAHSGVPLAGDQGESSSAGSAAL